MTIGASYPGRRRSRRHNPVFARERRARRYGLVLTLALGFFSVFVLRIGLNDAAAQAPGRSRTADVAAGHSLTGEVWRKHVRVIPPSHVPKDVAVAVAPCRG